MTAILTPPAISRFGVAASPPPRRSAFSVPLASAGAGRACRRPSADRAMTTPEASRQPAPWASVPGGGPGARMPAEVRFRQTANHPHETRQPPAPEPRCATTRRQRRECPPRCIFEKSRTNPMDPGNHRHSRRGLRPPAGSGGSARRDAFSKNREPTLWTGTTAAHPRRGRQPRAGSGGSARRDAFSKNREPTLWTGRTGSAHAAVCSRVPAAATGARRAAFSTNREPTRWTGMTAKAPKARRASTCRPRRRPLAEAQLQKNRAGARCGLDCR